MKAYPYIISSRCFDRTNVVKSCAGTADKSTHSPVLDTICTKFVVGVLKRWARKMGEIP